MQQYPMNFFVLNKLSAQNFALNQSGADPSSGGVYGPFNFSGRGLYYCGSQNSGSEVSATVRVSTSVPQFPLGLPGSIQSFVDGIELADTDWFILPSPNSLWYFGTDDSGVPGGDYIFLILDVDCFKFFSGTA